MPTVSYGQLSLMAALGTSRVYAGVPTPRQNQEQEVQSTVPCTSQQV